MSCGCAGNNCDNILYARRAAVCTLNKLRGEPFDYLRIRPSTFAPSTGAVTAPTETPITFWAHTHKDRGNYLAQAIAAAVRGITHTNQRKIKLEAGQLFTEDIPGVKVEFLPKIGDRVERPALSARTVPTEFEVFTVDAVESEIEGPHGMAVFHVLTLGATSKP